MNVQQSSFHPRKSETLDFLKLQCYLILALCSRLRCNNVSKFLSICPACGSDRRWGVTEVSRAGGLQLLCCVYHTGSLIVNWGTPLLQFCSVCVSFSKAKNIKLCPSNLPRLHVETQTGSALPFRAPQRGHAPSLSFPLVVKALEGIILSLNFYSFFL